jgi:cation diffusion facilitator CzcD-associated flavoprotein CzcO
LDEGCRTTDISFHSEWKWPKIEGLDMFKGKKMHSAKWDKDYDLKGKRVAVIGGGSSAVQIIPSIQPSMSICLFPMCLPLD